MVFGEPGVVEAQSLRKLDLSKKLLESLAFRHPGSRLIVTEGSKTHAHPPLESCPEFTARLSFEYAFPRARSQSVYNLGALTITVESMLATVGRPHLAMVISISSRRILSTRTTPFSPS